MTFTRLALTCSLLAASTSLAGCLATTGSESEGDIATTQEAEDATNGLTMNGLTMNGLTMNGLTMNGLTMNGLTMNGLTLTSSVSSALNTDALARLYFSYVVSCALPAGQGVTFPVLADHTNYTFPGEIGVAPQWGVDGGACDATCQQWVSACVISRVNALGVHVPLSIRGNSPALATTPAELAAYPHREATYFGNVLRAPEQLYACRAASDDQTLIGRPCGAGADTSTCLIKVLDDCAARCGTTGSADGFFVSCATPTAGTFMPAVTVYRQ